MSLFLPFRCTSPAKSRFRYANSGHSFGKLILLVGIWLPVSFWNSDLTTAFSGKTAPKRTPIQQTDGTQDKSLSSEQDDTSTDSSLVPLLTREELQDGWIALWDQATTYGWRNTKSTEIVDGVWILNQEPSVVRTAAEFRDFALQIEYSLDSESDAELLLRTNPVAKQSGVDHGSIQLPATTGTEFQSLHVSCCETFVQLDSQPVEGNPLNRGYIGFRVNQGQLKIKSLKIQPINRKVITDVSPQRHWAKNPDSEGDLTFQDQTMSLNGGPFHLTLTADHSLALLTENDPKNTEGTGFLVSDFLLQFECKASEATNSGIFFRCIPGESMNGYEAQINNQFLEDDRSKPADCGTGGIFRRSEARKIVADPDQWFSETIVVNGSQISVWVNGYQVTDWSDQRAPHPNPRKGRRLEAGEIQFQSHDADTEASFRNLLIAPYSKRAVDRSKLPK